MRPKKLVHCKRSAGCLLETQRADATCSQYRQGNQEDLENNKIHNKNKTCSHCGKRGHGKNSTTKTRKNDCPAYGMTCAYSVLQAHFFKKPPFGDLQLRNGCQEKNLKGRTLYGLSHEGLMRQTACSPHFTLLLPEGQVYAFMSSF